MKKSNWIVKVAGIFLLWAAATALPAQTFTTLVNFNGNNGANPFLGSLVQGGDGNLYGTTEFGGPRQAGTVFKLTPSGTLTTLYSFPTFADGCNPASGLVLGSDGNLYGTTETCGATSGGCPFGCGTVFRISPAGAFITLHTFAATDGYQPEAAMIQAPNGNFIGTTELGGAFGFGVVFEMSPRGAVSTLHSFSGYPSDGAYPLAGLVRGSDGNFYGTTERGGASTACQTFGGVYGCGIVFKISSGGVLTKLHSFDTTDGALPTAGLLQAPNGNFYGTTSDVATATFGTIFAITPAGALTTIYNFCSQSGCADGQYPGAGLVQATDGNFYGSTGQSGSGNGGTIFELTPAGTLTTLHSFSGTDGQAPFGAMFQGTNGTLYGTTSVGGANGDGTVFSLAVGLGPFVQSLPASGMVGATIQILGTNLTGASRVNFNGTDASFNVISSSLITAKVPAGATTGAVHVATPSGMFKSNHPFQVRP